MTLERRKEIESVIGKLEEILKRIERFGEDERNNSRVWQKPKKKLSVTMIMETPCLIT